jgi:hypothetical protein
MAPGSWANTYIGDTRGKIAILLEARRRLDVSYLLPQIFLLGFQKDEDALYTASARSIVRRSAMSSRMSPYGLTLL